MRVPPSVLFCAVVSAMLCLTACGSGDEPIRPPQPDGFSAQVQLLERSSVVIGRRHETGDNQQPTHDDRLMVRSIGFRQELVFEPFVLDGAYEIEYLPIVVSKDASAWLFSLFLTDEKGTVHTLDQKQPLATQSRGLAGSRRAAQVADVVSVDLGRWAGTEIVFTWQVTRANTASERLPLPTGHVGRLSLRRVEEAQPRPPDILLVCSDAHRFDFASSSDGEAAMPNLARFAASAVTFDNAISTASWTLPAVASVFTGLYPRAHRTGRTLESGPAHLWEPSEHRAPGRFPVVWGDRFHVLSAFPEELETITERLSRRGYTTIVVSANGLLRLSGLGQDGADIFHSIGQSRVGRVEEILSELGPVLHNRRPIFLYLHLIDVHDYLHLPLTAIPDEVEAAGPAAVQRYQYGHEVQKVDGFFGFLVEWWDTTIGDDRSTVAFFSDHGEHLRDPGGPKHGHGTTMHDVLLHVPLVVRFPGDEQVLPTVVPNTVSLVDLAATVLDLGDTDIESLPGRSLLGLARDRVDKDRIVFADYQLMGGELSAAQSGRYKMVKDFSHGTTSLYDLLAPSEHGEPAQLVDDPELLRRLEDAFLRYSHEAEAVGAGLESQQVIDGPDAQEQLRALGYTE